MGVGWYRTLNARAERKELMREEKTSRIHQLPFLYAERDRDIYRRSRAAEAREAIIMKDVKGWEVRCPSYSPSLSRCPPASPSLTFGHL
jgi:hypothetical protein